ncbi:MAG: hypothetical protein F4153_11390 [Acidimicrobiia bacterium]|nr:hypothetical protein [Acidimicrobiia bacterium]
MSGGEDVASELAFVGLAGFASGFAFCGFAGDRIDGVGLVQAPRAALGGRAGQREEALWRLLRLQPASYVVSFDVWPEARVQPVVHWRGDLVVKAASTPVHVDGHVEVR